MALATLDNVRSERNIFGFKAFGNVTATLTHSVFSGNNFAGVWSDGAVVTIDGSQISNAGANGVLSNGASTLRIGNSVVSGNATGLTSTSGGALLSFGTNEVVANGVNGAPTGGAPLS